MSTQNAATKIPEQTITYELSVTVTRPVRTNYDDQTTQEIAEWMVSREGKREFEREVLQALRKIGGKCDVEVMEVHS